MLIKNKQQQAIAFGCFFGALLNNSVLFIRNNRFSQSRSTVIDMFLCILIFLSTQLPVSLSPSYIVWVLSGCVLSKPRQP